MRKPKVRVEFKNFLQTGEGFVVLSGIAQKNGFEGADSQVERVEFPGALNLGERLFVPPRVGE